MSVAPRLRPSQALDCCARLSGRYVSVRPIEAGSLHLDVLHAVSQAPITASTTAPEQQSTRYAKMRIALNSYIFSLDEDVHHLSCATHWIMLPVPAACDLGKNSPGRRLLASPR